MDSIFINQFHIVKPKNCFPQTELLKWITQAHQQAESFKSKESSLDSDLIEKLFQRYGVKETQILQRYFECSDVFTYASKNAEIYSISKDTPHGVDVLQRAHFFSERAYDVLKEIYDLSKVRPRPHHLIHVTCTGYISPSAAQRMLTADNWGQRTDITHAYHMGCYAALPAIRIAKSLVASENIQVDVVHNEMCGLHMDTLAQTPEQMIIQTLFADGHVKYTLSKNKSESGENLKLLGIQEMVIPNSQLDMSWIPAPWGMQMNLSRDVPLKIKTELKTFSEELFAKAGISATKATEAVFAVHPGGPKIIDAVQTILELSDSQISESRKILFERGNMSSATLPHIWSEIIHNRYPVGTLVISFAFGPGLTLFGSVFEVC